MDENSPNLQKLKELRALLDFYKGADARHAAARANIKAQIRELAAKTPHSASCPFCGRLLQIPPCSKPVRLGCKVCQNTFVFDPLTDQISIPREAQKAQSAPATAPPLPPEPAKTGRAAIFLCLIILAAALAAALCYYRPGHEPETPPPLLGEPAAELDEIQKQMKSLAE